MIGLTELATPAFGAAPNPYARPTPAAESLLTLQPGQPLMKLEDAYIKLTLDHVQGNRKRAAEMLEISLRTLQNRIAALREDAKVTTPGS